MPCRFRNYNATMPEPQNSPSHQPGLQQPAHNNSLRSEESGEDSASRSNNATPEPLFDLSGSDAVSASLPPLLLRT